MRATVCQLQTNPEHREAEWAELARHLDESKSEFLLLPEMPFDTWLAASPEFDPGRWQAAVAAHEGWIARLGELGVTTVAGTRPVTDGAERRNRAYVWEADGGLTDTHDKYYLPNEPWYWEATWYDPPPAPEFKTCTAGPARAGFQICTEMWFMQHAREYGQVGSIQEATTDAVRAIEEVGSTISQINEIATTISAAVQQQGAATGEISSNVQEAARGTQQVDENISLVGEGARETGSAAEQVLAGAQELTQQSAKLREGVENFLAQVRAA